MAVVLTIVALLLPPVSTSDISARLFPHGLGGGSGTKGGGATIPGTGVDTIGFNPSVTLGGPLVSHPRLVMTYSVNTTAAVYIRVANDTQFVEGQWYPGERRAAAGCRSSVERDPVPARRGCCHAT